MFLDCQEAETKCIRDFNNCLSKEGGRTITKERLENLFKTEYKELLDKPENKALKEDIYKKIADLDDKINLKKFFDCISPLYEKCPDFFKK